MMCLQGADYIIALTHMRWPNDIRLAEQVDEIDLILGGHDHDYNVKVVGIWACASQTGHSVKYLCVYQMDI